MSCSLHEGFVSLIELDAGGWKVEGRNALQNLILVQNSMSCVQVSKGLFVADEAGT